VSRTIKIKGFMYTWRLGEISANFIMMFKRLRD